MLYGVSLEPLVVADGLAVGALDLDDPAEAHDEVEAEQALEQLVERLISEAPVGEHGDLHALGQDLPEGLQERVLVLVSPALYLGLHHLGAGLPGITSRLGEFPLPGKDSLEVYEQDTPHCLGEAIVRAAEGLATLRAAAALVRQWVAAQYSSAAAVRKAEAVFEAAVAAGSAGPPPT